ncbi:hypothetical protein GWI33_011677, partial [Rhynchophorus ferrugineus]
EKSGKKPNCTHGGQIEGKHVPKMSGGVLITMPAHQTGKIARSMLGSIKNSGSATMRPSLSTIKLLKLCWISDKKSVEFLGDILSECLHVAFIALGVIGHNQSVTIAACILLFIQQTPLAQYAPLLEKYGLQLGIIALTVAVMAPLISGKVKTEDMINVFYHWKTIVAVLVGVLVAWLGGRGATLMTEQPMIVTGLMVGTIIGIAFFRGIPVGPLIAAGIVSLLLWK